MSQKASGGLKMPFNLSLGAGREIGCFPLQVPRMLFPIGSRPQYAPLPPWECTPGVLAYAGGQQPPSLLLLPAKGGVTTLAPPGSSGG